MSHGTGERRSITLPPGGSHTAASHSDTSATGSELNELTDGSATTLHSHAGGGSPWSLDVDDALTTLTDITGYSGTWSISTYLQCVGATSTQCRAFSDTEMLQAGVAIIEVEVEIPSSLTTANSHVTIGFGPGDVVGAVVFGIRGDDKAYFEEDGVAALLTTVSYTVPATGTWVTLRMMKAGGHYTGWIDDVLMGAVNRGADLYGAPWKPYVKQYNTAAMTARYRNLKAWSMTLP